MEKFCNIQTFADNSSINEKIPKKLIKLLLFTSYSKFSRNVNSNLHFSDIVKKNTTNGEDYVFNYNGKMYPFSVFSDNEIQKFDKKHWKV